MQVRFYHESAINSDKTHFLAGVDFMDIEPRREEVPTAKTMQVHEVVIKDLVNTSTLIAKAVETGKNKTAGLEEDG